MKQLLGLVRKDRYPILLFLHCDGLALRLCLRFRRRDVLFRNLILPVRLRYGKQDCGILYCLHRIESLWYDEEISDPRLPPVVLRREANPSVQDEDGRLARIQVFAEFLLPGECNYCLTKHMFVSTKNGIGASSTRRPSGSIEVAASKCDQRELLHLIALQASKTRRFIVRTRQ
ncbi:hypothetical protein BFN01_13810 [Microbacterium sp. AR7-10]|nr:hypothetical protein BFN01_13810 [Microbacterium sp. AR7-10]